MCASGDLFGIGAEFILGKIIGDRVSNEDSQHRTDVGSCGVSSVPESTVVSPCPCREVGGARTRGRKGAYHFPTPALAQMCCWLARPWSESGEAGARVGDFLVEGVDECVPVSEANQPWGLGRGDFSLEV